MNEALLSPGCTLAVKNITYFYFFFPVLVFSSFFSGPSGTVVAPAFSGALPEFLVPDNSLEEPSSTSFWGVTDAITF